MHEYVTCVCHFLQNAHAYVSAAFVMEVDSSSWTVTNTPSLVFGGIQSHAVRHTHMYEMTTCLYIYNSILDDCLCHCCTTQGSQTFGKRHPKL